jgi:outer membrane protein assembly factor BamB
MKHYFFAALACAAFTAGIGADDWLRFRGPKGSGVSADEKVPTEWSATKNLKWKVKLPEGGPGSPIVVGDKVFLTGGSSSGRSIKRQLICVDRNKGEIAWTREVTSTGRTGTFGRNNSGPAASTPVSDGERVYVFFGDAGIYAYDLKGEKLWNKSAGTESNSMFGSGSSPVLYKDLVIVTAGYESASFYGFDKKTGEQKWKAEAGPLTRCYGTPVVVKNSEGKDELLISVPNEVWSLNPETGKLNWYCQTAVAEGGRNSACASLVVADGIAYALGGGPGGYGRTAVKIGGKDDVSKTNVVWSDSGGPYAPSPVLYKDHIFYVERGRGRGSALICVDAKTGKQAGRASIPGDYYASPTVVNGKLLLVSRFDGTTVLEASPKLTKLATNDLGDSSDFSGSPAISNGQMFLRSMDYLYCIAAE